MLNRKALGLVAVAVALVLPATALALKLRPHAKSKRSKVTRIPKSSTSTGVAEIGTLYAGSGAADHYCTASVVDSPRGDTLITAAHCVTGSGSGMVFVPGQRGSQAPYGRWTITAAYVDPKWISRQDPDDDVAFLTVAPQTVDGVSTEIQRVTGGYRLGTTGHVGQKVTVIGYPAGSTDDPITCTAAIYETRTYPAFDCRGYVGGTSGSPWLRQTRQGTEIVGVIGGLNQGGCVDYTSYSSPLGRDAETAYLRAADDAPADVAPKPGSDGC